MITKIRSFAIKAGEMTNELLCNMYGQTIFGLWASMTQIAAFATLVLALFLIVAMMASGISGIYVKWILSWAVAAMVTASVMIMITLSAMLLIPLILAIHALLKFLLRVVRRVNSRVPH